MTPEDAFSKRFRYQVNDLGNLVRGLEMAVEYVKASPSPGVCDSLTRDVRAILKRIPVERLREELTVELKAAFGESAGASDTPAPAEAPTNAVLMPFIATDRGVTGLVRRFWIKAADPYTRSPTFPAEAGADFQHAIADGCTTAQKLFERAGIFDANKIPEDYQFHVDAGPFNHNLPLREQSGWLAAAISYFSLHSGLAVPGQVAATGFITGGRIGTLEHVEEKIGTCMREWSRLDRFLVLTKEPLPAAYRTHSAVRQVKSFKEAVSVLWGDDWRLKLSPPRLNVFAAMERAMYAYAKEQNLCSAFERFTLIDRFLSKQRGGWERYRFLCDWRLACCHNHLGRRGEATRLFTRWVDKAENLWRDGVIDSENYANFFASYGFFLARTGDLDHGIDRMRHALTLSAEHWTPRMHRAKLLGALGHLLMYKREFEEAERNLLQAFEFADEEDKTRRRNAMVRLYREWGREAEACRWEQRSAQGERRSRTG